MIDYEFRANRINNDIIVYGLLTYHNDEICIITSDNNKYFIKENTIQEYTRLKDKNNNKVFIGDKLKHFEGLEFEVVFSDIKGVLLSSINDNGEYANGNPYWIDECEIIY
jgi:hypothetical protein